MECKYNPKPNLSLCREIFISQHLKYTPPEYPKSIGIENFSEYLENVWKETVEMLNDNKNTKIENYDLLYNEDLQGSIIGFRDCETFHIRHFNNKDIENISKTIFTDFAKIANVKSITIRTRKGIQKYHGLIKSWGFEYKEHIGGYDICILNID